jgi:hypothetical protein
LKKITITSFAFILVAFTFFVIAQAEQGDKSSNQLSLEHDHNIKNKGPDQLTIPGADGKIKFNGQTFVDLSDKTNENYSALDYIEQKEENTKTSQDRDWWKSVEEPDLKASLEVEFTMLTQLENLEVKLKSVADKSPEKVELENKFDKLFNSWHAQKKNSVKLMEKYGMDSHDH